MQKYFLEGHAYNAGLAESTVLFRRHTGKVQCLNELWHDEVKRHSRYDQLSFDYVMRRLRFKYSHIPGNIYSNAHFEWLPYVQPRNSRVAAGSAYRSRPRQSAENLISMVYLYYDNPQMLRRQISCWNAYAKIFERPPEVLLIDDGSPDTFAADLVRKYGCQIPIKVYRIHQDIAWNFTGARNPGCTQAGNWIYVSDIDTLLEAEQAWMLFQGRSLNPRCFYMPRRVWLPDMKDAATALVNLLFHKDRYLEVGGYDEDYAGYYGREEVDFYERLKRGARKVYRKDVVIQVTPPTMVADARTRGPRLRDKTRNTEVYSHKKAAGFIKPVNPLRFAWERML